MKNGENEVEDRLTAPLLANDYMALGQVGGEQDPTAQALEQIEQAQGDGILVEEAKSSNVQLPKEKQTPFQKARKVLNARIDAERRVIRLDGLNLDAEDVKALMTDLERIKWPFWLDLSDNVISKLPEGLGELKNLEVLKLRNNNLGELPTNLHRNDLTVDARENQLSIYAASIMNVSTRGATYQNRSSPKLSDRNPSQADIVLSYICTDLRDMEDHLKKIKDLDNVPGLGALEVPGNFWGKKKKKPSKIVSDFLAMVNLSGEIAKQIYKPATRELLKDLFEEHNPPRNKCELLQKMDDCTNKLNEVLGVQSPETNRWLIGLRVKQFRGSNMPVSKLMDSAIKAEALKAKIIQVIPDIENKPKLLEGVLQVMYSESERGGAFKAKGSLATTFESGTRFLKTGTTKRVMDALISKISKADSDRLNTMLGDLSKARRAFKINSITEPYFAELGVLSDRENAIAYYTKQLNAVTGDKKLINYCEAKGISHGFDVSESQEALRMALLHASDDEILETVEGFYRSKQFQDLHGLFVKSGGTLDIGSMTKVMANTPQGEVKQEEEEKELLLLDLMVMGEVSNDLEQIDDSPQAQVSPSTAATRSKRMGQMTMC